ncbi:MAG: hypothetical protein H6621_05510 [Halobacteriovoraceae bacterium]|nr:hypothetical protein [Halobacteriovoraceae bacterium]
MKKLLAILFLSTLSLGSFAHEEVKIFCMSEGVADAGFMVQMNHVEKKIFDVKISTVSFFGAEEVYSGEMKLKTKKKFDLKKFKFVPKEQYFISKDKSTKIQVVEPTVVNQMQIAMIDGKDQFEEMFTTLECDFE